MFHIRRRRTLVRIISFVSAALAVSTAAAVYSSWLAYSYRRSIEYSYQRALSDLSTHVNNIDLGLQKGMYAGTSPQLAGISAQIWRDAGAAKTNLAQIPLYRNHLDNTYKFISQVGDYANSLTKDASESKKITNDDRAKMKSLSTFAEKLSTQLSKMIDDMYAGRLTIFTANNAIKSNVSASTPGQTNIDTGLQDVENDFTSMPSLIYDGPFSDNMLKKESVFTKGKTAVSRDKARAAAAGFLGVNAAALKDAGETGGTLPSFNFAEGTATISVAKAGGYVVRMIDGRAAGLAKLSTDQARQKGQAFLKARGISSMKESYYQTGNDICVINYAYTQGNVICYPDLIKVAVALDNGTVTSFDASGYLMNHQARNLPDLKVSAETVEKLVSPLLKVQSAALCVIPMEDATESYCYEIRCVSQNGQNVLDYYDTQTGREQQLLMLIKTNGGILAS